MALVLNDRVQETCSAPGTGAVTLLGAATGFQTFLSGVGDGNTCYYCIADQGGANWEVGLGTYASSGNTLTRTTPYAGSSATPVNFSSGIQNVFVTYPAEKSVNLDATGNVSALGTVTSGAWQGTAVGILYGGTGQTTANGAFNALVPSQTGNDGKYLTTDGSNTSWATVSAGLTQAKATGLNFIFGF